MKNKAPIIKKSFFQELNLYLVKQTTNKILITNEFLLQRNSIYTSIFKDLAYIIMVQARN